MRRGDQAGAGLVSDWGARETTIATSAPPEGGVESPIVSRGERRGRLALGFGAARLVFMATIAFWLAWGGVSDQLPGQPLYSIVFNLVVPLVFAAMGTGLAWWALTVMLAFARADEPQLKLTNSGIEAPLAMTRPIAWDDITRAHVFRRKGRARVVIELAAGSACYRRFWPFWRAGTINLYLPEPDRVVAAIRGHPNYRGAPAGVDDA